MNTKRWVAVGVFLGLLFIQLVSYFTIQGDDIGAVSGATWSTKYYKMGTSGTIAILDINGIIQESSESSMFTAKHTDMMFLNQFGMCFCSSDIDGIVLR